MSSDNYYLVRERGNRYAVDMQFMSDDAPTPIDEQTRWFDSLIDATQYAAAEYSEYGVLFEWEKDDD